MRGKPGYLFLAAIFMVGFGYLTYKAYEYPDVLGAMIWGSVTAGIGSYIYFWYVLPFLYDIREKNTSTGKRESGGEKQSN